MEPIKNFLVILSEPFGCEKYYVYWDMENLGLTLSCRVRKEREIQDRLQFAVIRKSALKLLKAAQIKYTGYNTYLQVI